MSCNITHRSVSYEVRNAARYCVIRLNNDELRELLSKQFPGLVKVTHYGWQSKTVRCSLFTETLKLQRLRLEFEDKTCRVLTAMPESILAHRRELANELAGVLLICRLSAKHHADLSDELCKQGFTGQSASGLFDLLVRHNSWFKRLRKIKDDLLLRAKNLASGLAAVSSFKNIAIFEFAFFDLGGKLPLLVSAA